MFISCVYTCGPAPHRVLTAAVSSNRFREKKKEKKTRKRNNGDGDTSIFSLPFFLLYSLAVHTAAVSFGGKKKSSGILCLVQQTLYRRLTSKAEKKFFFFFFKLVDFIVVWSRESKVKSITSAGHTHTHKKIATEPT